MSEFPRRSTIPQMFHVEHLLCVTANLYVGEAYGRVNTEGQTVGNPVLWHTTEVSTNQELVHMKHCTRFLHNSVQRIPKL